MRKETSKTIFYKYSWSILLKVLALAILLLSFSVTCFANSDSRYFALKRLSKVEGTWYTVAGKPAVTISNGYINDCEVVDGGNIAGGGTWGGYFQLRVASGYQTWYIESGGTLCHKYLCFNHGQYLRNTAEPEYGESIGGIYLGMGIDEVQQLYGAPSRQKSITNGQILYYDQSGFSVSCNGGIVTGITMYAGSDRSLDQSGISCDNASEFRSDNFLRYGHVIRSIGNGETLFFESNPRRILLSIYDN